MTKKKIDNNGFTLLEMVICFALLGILMVAAAQIISSATQIYYYTKSVSYGTQASQIIATELRGDIEEALPLLLKDTCLTDIEKSKVSSNFASSNNFEKNYSVYISSDGSALAIINNKGEQVTYYLIDDSNVDITSDNPEILVRNSIETYDELNYNEITPKNRKVKEYTKEYVGMNYKVKDIKFSLISEDTNVDGKIPLPGNNAVSKYPVIQVDVTVCNEQYGDYTCIEYIPLYNFYGLSDERRLALIHSS